MNFNTKVGITIGKQLYQWLYKRRFIKMTDKLKPCPFCGSEDLQIIIEQPFNIFFRCYKVMCFECKATSALAETKGMAIEAWNRRV